MATGTVLVTGTAQVTVVNSLEARTAARSGWMAAVDHLNLLLTGTSQFIFNQGTLRTGSPWSPTTRPSSSATARTPPRITSFPRRHQLVRQGTAHLHQRHSGRQWPHRRHGHQLRRDRPRLPGSAPGERLDINGGLVLSNSSDLRFEIGGYNPDCEFDFLRTTGGVVLGGKLSVSLINNFQSVMTNGASFTVMPITPLSPAHSPTSPAAAC